MTNEHLLLLGLLLLPLAGAILVAFLGREQLHAIRWICLGASVAELVLAVVLAGRFMAMQREYDSRKGVTSSAGTPTFRPEFVPGSPALIQGADGSTRTNPHGTSWDLLDLGPGKVQFYMGIDGLNIWLIVLTAFLMLPSVLISWTHITERVNEFYAWLLVLQTTMMGIFLAFDIVLFYVFFELSLVPLFFLIGIWGGPERRYAARKFFIYTFLGSMLTLLGIFGVVLAAYHQTGVMTFSIPRLVELVHGQLMTADVDTRNYWNSVQLWVFIALMAGFAVKVPLVPFHTWLPLAHVEAPTAGSVDLAGVLLKVGSYGFLRLCIPLAPDVSLALGLPVVTCLAAIGIVYGALCAYSQDDVKRLVAYSSVSHLGLCMLGMFTLNQVGLMGSLMQMINHGLSTGLLFLLIGMIYERYHTRNLSEYGGMAARMPLFGAFMVFTCLSSVGLPGLNGFIGEILVLAGIFEYEKAAGHGYILAVVAGSGIVLGAWYLFTMMRKLLFGPVKEPEHGEAGKLGDMNFRELSIVTPLVVLCVFLGVYPQPVIRTAEPDLLTISAIADNARARADMATAQEQSEANKVAQGQ
ncbi:MAG: NuoM family protein [Gemmataceae bacterium]